MFKADYLGKHATDGSHTCMIEMDGTLKIYSFKFNAKGQAISFKHQGKLVARTYKSFKSFLGMPSQYAGILIAATQNAPLYHREYFEKYGR